MKEKTLRERFTNLFRSEESIERNRQEYFLTQLYENVNQGRYKRLTDTPEVQVGAERIAELIGTMTIHLMENTENGDVRVQNELSKKVDIYPYELGNRSVFMQSIVKSMIFHGNAVVIPKYTKEGFIKNFTPLDMRQVSFYYEDQKYYVEYDGVKFKHDEILHFVLNPDPYNPWMGRGYKVYLKDLVENLNQSSETILDFMRNKMTPSLIVKVDSFVDDFSNEEGRENIYQQYINRSKAGEPWIIPADLIDVKEVRPLTLNDVAIMETLEISKKGVASILGVPSFLLGIGEFNNDEYNHFIRSRIMPIAQIITQELTRKLLYSPTLYFNFNARSLYSYDLPEISQMAGDLFTKGIMTGNEVRDWLGLSPKEGLNELVVLENYIKFDDMDKQKKLHIEGVKE